MTDQQKRTAVNTATINFAKSIRDNAISKVIDVIKAAGSSTANAELLDPQLTLSETNVTLVPDEIKTVTVSYLGEGKITLSNDFDNISSYDAGTRTITLGGNTISRGWFMGGETNIIVNLSAAGIYNAATTSLLVTGGF